MVQLKYRWNPERVLFESETATTVKEAVVEAVKAKADFRGADLGGADLGGVNLRGADFRGAYFRGADFRWADFRGAYFRWADFRGADFRGADFRGADFRWADFRGAYFRWAKINWQSHDAIAEILRREAGDDIEKRKVAGLILISTDWCWDKFLAIESGLRDWALDTLAAFVVDGDDAPKSLKSRVAARAAEVETTTEVPASVE